MILLIDNYDSFTWNLVQRFGEIAPDIPVEVHRNDCVTGDEIAAMWQLIARGIVGYAPMGGTPTPRDLHVEDTAFFHSILTELGTRHTAERWSLTAVRSAGGLQLASVVEAVISGVANEAM